MTLLRRRILITLAIFITPLILGLLVTYSIINIQWPSFMAIQPSFRPMEQPLPIPANSVPIEGAAYIAGAGTPINTTPSDARSLQRGEALYNVHCALCHGDQGKGDGKIAASLVKMPADLASQNVTQLSDGELFMIVSNGVQLGIGAKGGMPPLRENLYPSERWDVVNYIRSLAGK